MAYDNTKDLFLDTGTKQTSKTYTAKSQKTVIDDIIGPSDTEHRVVSGDIRGADKSTIKGGNDTIDASTEYLKNATITGDAMVVSGSKLTGGNDRITVLRITHGDANILGDAKSVSNSTVTGGKDTIIVSGSITGTASNKALISGDLETFSGTNKTFTAGSDIITLRGSSSHVEIYGDVKTITGTGNKLLGGHDVVTLGTTTFGESRVVSDSLIDLGQGNDTLVAYSKLQSTSINGGSGNDTITVNSLENMKSILGGLGDDYITVNETINTGTISQISGGGGTNDTLELGKAITTTFSMGANLLNSGVKVVDFEKYVFAEVGSGGTLNGTSAAENISIKQLSSGKAYTLGGGDTVFVGQASGTALVDGGYGADKITVNNLYGSAAVLGGFGADVISIKNLHSGSVYTNNTANADDAARDTITVTTMKAGTVHGDMGNDLITVDDMQSGKISANGGNDVINVSYKANTGAARSIDGGGANDTINISNSAGSMELLGGAGADTFTITKSAGNITLGDIDTAVDSVFVDGVNYTTDIKNAQEGGQTSITVGDLTMHFESTTAENVIKEMVTNERSFVNSTLPQDPLYLDGGIGANGIINLQGAGGFVVTTSDDTGVVLEYDSTNDAGGTIHGSEAADTIKIAAIDGDCTVNGNGGDDTFNITSMDGGTVNGGAGNDTFTIKNLKWANIVGGAGNDTVTIASAPNPVNADGGSGTDTLTFTGEIGVGESLGIGDVTGFEHIVVEALKTGEFLLGAGSETDAKITINNMDGGSIRLSATANDYLSVDKIAGIEIDGGFVEDTDTLEVRDAVSGVVNMDHVKFFEKLIFNQVDAGANIQIPYDINDITIKNLSGGTMSIGSFESTFTATLTGSSAVLTAGFGKDVFKLSASSKQTVEIKDFEFNETGVLDSLFIGNTDVTSQINESAGSFTHGNITVNFT